MCKQGKRNCKSQEFCRGVQIFVYLLRQLKTHKRNLEFSWFIWSLLLYGSKSSEHNHKSKSNERPEKFITRIDMNLEISAMQAYQRNEKLPVPKLHPCQHARDSDDGFYGLFYCCLFQCTCQKH